MTEKEAIADYEKLTYDLAKCVSKMANIKNRMKFINEQMDWDGMMEVDFEEALEKLASVVSSSVIYTLESKYRDSDIADAKSTLEAYDEKTK